MHQIIDEIAALRHVLQSACKMEPEVLEVELEPINKSCLPGPALPWLFREKELMNRLESLTLVKQTLQLSLTTDRAWVDPAKLIVYGWSLLTNLLGHYY